LTCESYQPTIFREAKSAPEELKQDPSKIYILQSQLRLRDRDVASKKGEQKINLNSGAKKRCGLVFLKIQLSHPGPKSKTGSDRDPSTFVRLAGERERIPSRHLNRLKRVAVFFATGINKGFMKTTGKQNPILSQLRRCH
jgi:hypothetical protein